MRQYVREATAAKTHKTKERWFVDAHDRLNHIIGARICGPEVIRELSRKIEETEGDFWKRPEDE